MRIGIPSLLLMAASLWACASSPEVVAERTPNRAGTAYSHVLVYVEAPDREWRESLETLLCEELSAQDVAAVPAFTVSDGMGAAGDVDAVVAVVVSDTGIREQWVEQPAMSGTLSSNSLLAIGGSAAGPSPVQCKNRELGGTGFSADVPWAVIAVSVVDRETRETVWKSAVEFEGTVRSDFADLRRDYARTIARKMTRDGLW